MQPSAPAPTQTSLERDAVALGERRVQPVRAAVRVAVQLARRARHRLERGRERPERPLVRRELDDALEPELALHVLDRLPRLVRRQRVDARPEERVVDPPGRCRGARCHRADPSERRGRRRRTVRTPPQRPCPGHVSVTGVASARRARRRRLRGMPELGLFPLPLVLVPTERIPLHIFEPRYRELIERVRRDRRRVRARARDRRRRGARDRHARAVSQRARGARRRDA